MMAANRKILNLVKFPAFMHSVLAYYYQVRKAIETTPRDGGTTWATRAAQGRLVAHLEEVLGELSVEQIEAEAILDQIAKEQE